MERDTFLRPHGRVSLTSARQSSPADPRARPQFRHIFVCIFMLKLLTQFIFALLELPLVRLAEDLVCHSLLGVDHDNNGESRCKSESVQDATAQIIGLKTTFDALPCVLTAWLYGQMSDLWGRKTVMFVSNTGQFMTLCSIIFVGFFMRFTPAKLLWLPSAWLLAGGGMRVEMAMQYTALCDVVSWEQRTRLLSFLHASDGIGALLGYVLSSCFMQYSLRWPFGIAFVTFIAKFFILRYTPETAPCYNELSNDIISLDEYTSSDVGTDGTVPQQMQQISSYSLTSNRFSTINWQWGACQTQIRKFRDLVNIRGVNVVFTSFAIKRVAFASLAFVFQYASEILEQDLSKTYLIRVFHQFSVAILFICLLPLLTRNLLSPAKDVWVIRVSLTTLMIGFYVVWNGRSLSGFALGLGICGLGEGLEVGLQSLGSYLVGDVDQAAFFSIASMLGVIGELVGGPLMASAYTIRDNHHRPLGYCFLLSTGVFGCVFASSYLLKTSRV
ncbi:MFS general substrate transporter [Melanomma pulvis-pyrius CBS 109.77]|uniref:MFS general substrate transporter n=1 Tax=Melanomma pulvis-pyrius CBS 109.77 TaxID=1314802 RepID=A0A6A6WSD7_9PLEO|nr:MFS general substrate transporter [Melanomma pulvis-pyrius CBS 109.77]